MKNRRKLEVTLVGSVLLADAKLAMPIREEPLVSRTMIEVPQNPRIEHEQNAQLPFIIGAHLIGSMILASIAKRKTREDREFRRRLEKEKNDHFEGVEAVEKGRAKYGYFIIEAHEIAEKEEKWKFPKDRAIKDRYDEYLNRVKAAIGKGQTPMEAISEALSDLSYFRYIDRSSEMLKYKHGNCVAITELCVSILHDLGYTDSVKIGIYKKHMTALFTYNGKKYDITSGRKVTIDAVEITPIEYLKRYERTIQMGTRRKVFDIVDLSNEAQKKGIEFESKDRIYTRKAVGKAETQDEVAQKTIDHKIPGKRNLAGIFAAGILVIAAAIGVNTKNRELQQEIQQVRETNRSEQIVESHQNTGGTQIEYSSLTQTLEDLNSPHDAEYEMRLRNEIDQMKIRLETIREKGEAIVYVAEMARKYRILISQVLSREHTQEEADQIGEELQRTIEIGGRLIQTITDNETLSDVLISHSEVLYFLEQPGAALVERLERRSITLRDPSRNRAFEILASRNQVEAAMRVPDGEMVEVAANFERWTDFLPEYSPRLERPNIRYFEFPDLPRETENQSMAMISPIPQTRIQTNLKIFAIARIINEFNDRMHGQNICDSEDEGGSGGFNTRFTVNVGEIENRMERLAIDRGYFLDIIANTTIMQRPDCFSREMMRNHPDQREDIEAVLDQIRQFRRTIRDEDLARSPRLREAFQRIENEQTPHADGVGFRSR